MTSPAFRISDIAYLVDEEGRPTGPVRILTASRLPDAHGVRRYRVQGAFGGGLYAFDVYDNLYRRPEPVTLVPESQLRPLASISEFERWRLQELQRQL